MILDLESSFYEISMNLETFTLPYESRFSTHVAITSGV